MSKASNIKDSLLKQLEDNHANVDHFKSLIDDYLWYWKQEKAMQKDIKERGFSFKTTSASGFPIDKENPSIKNAVAYNKQKLAILKELELNTRNVVMEDDNEL